MPRLVRTRDSWERSGGRPTGRRRRRQSRLPRRPALGLESLEPRLPLDGAEGFLLGADAYLTLSFAPDQTDLAGSPSSLYETFGAVASQNDWQQAILEAFQTWAVHTNADIGVVTDSGDPFGVSGRMRDDARFGDIRIGAAQLSPDVFAVSVPLPTGLTGTWVGDVIFNSDAPFADRDDIFAVALHEAGNVFGLGDGTDPLSPTFSPGIPTVTVPTVSDVANLVSLYGQRAPDYNEGDDPAGNDTFNTATELEIPEVNDVRDGSAPAIIYGDVAGPQDVDRFEVEVPSGYTGGATFTVRTRGISLLAPQVTVYSQDEQFLTQSASTEPAGGVVVAELADVGTNERFYVDVRAVTSNVFATGGYSLVATFDANLQTDPATIDRVAGGAYRFLDPEQIQEFFEGPDDDGDDDDPLFSDDFFQNENTLGATPLQTVPGFVDFTRYETVASISGAADVDYYQITSANVPAGAANVMTVSVRSIDVGGLVPVVTLLDANENVLPAEVLVNGGGDLVVQATGVGSEQIHYIRVAGADTGGVFASGNYQLTVVFGSASIQLDTFAAGTLSATEVQQVQGLFVARTQLFHVLLDVAPVATNVPIAIVTTIVDANLQPVHQIVARPGDIRSGKSVLLAPGTYGVQIVAATLDGSPLPDLAYTIRGLAVSDPLAIDPSDPTGEGAFQCPDTPDTFCYPGPIISDNPYLWTLFLGDMGGDPAATNFLNSVAASAAQSTGDQRRSSPNCWATGGRGSGSSRG